MTKPADIPQDVAVAALEMVLKPLGTSLRHYMPSSKAAAIEAMQGVLAAQAERSTEAEQYRCYRLMADDSCFPFAGDQASMMVMRDVRNLAAAAIRGEA